MRAVSGVCGPSVVVKLIRQTGIVESLHSACFAYFYMAECAGADVIEDGEFDFGADRLCIAHTAV